MKEFTEEQKEKWLNNQCPFCDSKNITYGSAESIGEYAWRWYWCKDCIYMWKAHFDLVSVGIPEDWE